MLLQLSEDPALFEIYGGDMLFLVRGIATGTCGMVGQVAKNAFEKVVNCFVGEDDINYDNLCLLTCAYLCFQMYRRWCAVATSHVFCEDILERNGCEYAIEALQVHVNCLRPHRPEHKLLLHAKTDRNRSNIDDNKSKNVSSTIGPLSRGIASRMRNKQPRPTDSKDQTPKRQKMNEEKFLSINTKLPNFLNQIASLHLHRRLSNGKVERVLDPKAVGLFETDTTPVTSREIDTLIIPQLSTSRSNDHALGTTSCDMVMAPVFIRPSVPDDEEDRSAAYPVFSTVKVGKRNSFEEISLNDDTCSWEGNNIRNQEEEYGSMNREESPSIEGDTGKLTQEEQPNINCLSSLIWNDEINSQDLMNIAADAVNSSRDYSLYESPRENGDNESIDELVYFSAPSAAIPSNTSSAVETSANSTSSASKDDTSNTTPSGTLKPLVSLQYCEYSGSYDPSSEGMRTRNVIVSSNTSPDSKTESMNNTKHTVPARVSRFSVIPCDLMDSSNGGGGAGGGVDGLNVNKMLTQLCRVLHGYDISDIFGDFDFSKAELPLTGYDHCGNCGATEGMSLQGVNRCVCSTCSFAIHPSIDYGTLTDALVKVDIAHHILTNP